MAVTKGQQTRVLLIEAALQQFATHGYHGASMRQIAEAAGIAVGGIYNHFRSKEEMLSAVILTWHPLNLMLPALSTVTADSLEAFMRAAAQLFMDQMSARPELLRIFMIELFEFEGAHLPQLFGAVWPNAVSLMDRLGALDPRLRHYSPLTFVRIFVSALLGFYMSGLLLSKLPAPQLHQIGTLDDLVNVLVHGLLAAESTAVHALE